MTDIIHPIVTSQAPGYSSSHLTESEFNEKVLSYIKTNTPQGRLSDLLGDIKALSPDKVLSMHALNKALLYANTTLRNNDEYRNYTDIVLDSMTTQLVGVNMLYNTILYNSMLKSDDNI